MKSTSHCINERSRWMDIGNVPNLCVTPKVTIHKGYAFFSPKVTLGGTTKSQRSVTGIYFQALCDQLDQTKLRSVGEKNHKESNFCHFFILLMQHDACQSPKNHEKPQVGYIIKIKKINTNLEMRRLVQVDSVFRSPK